MSLPQPVPPSWKDLGKASKDLLDKDYPFSSNSIEVNTKANDVAFKVTGNDAGGNPSGELEAKFNNKKHGFAVTQTWTTSNFLKSNFELENVFAKGTKVELNTVLQPEKQTKSALVQTTYKQSGFNVHSALDVFKGPTFTADAVFGRDGFLVGGEASYDVTGGNIARWAAAVGYNAPEYAVTIHGLNNFKKFSASYYHRVNPDVEAGAKAVYDSKATTGGVALEVGAKTYLDPSSFVKTKISNTGVLALGYTQALRPGVKVSLGLAVDTQKLNTISPTGPAHKIGASFVFTS
ncbi:hypothetical protein D9758_002606 [Tetrapyrgos nigripes]|uniref:Voltage-dependent ion-selective channel n=1 Tax=Tetrapyrgos nigripes TaxID=182062 RepID=A0A8H5GR04_9AGAR|nr:hypothetical protein D9758_002606 [Tetrapyrgos nigripes]